MKTTIPGKRPISATPSGANAIYIPGDSPVQIFKPGLKWLLRDEFATALAAGSVNGTYPEVGGARVVVDTGSKLSISGGYLVINNGDWDDPVLYYTVTFSRTPGRMFLTTFTESAFHNYPMIALGTSYALAGVKQSLTSQADGALQCDTVANIYNILAGTKYYVGMLLRSLGAFYFIKDSNWILMYPTINSADTDLVLALKEGNASNTGSFSFLRIPQDLWLPTPLLSDGMGSTFGLSDGLGHAEGIAGGLGAGGGGMTWTARLGTWANAAGVCSCTELDVGASIGIATATLNTADVLYSCVLGYSAGAGGVIVRYTDAANYVYAINDGTNVKLFEVTTVSPYPGTQRGTAVKAPAAGARLIVDVSGAASRVYYNESLIFTYASVADTTGKTIGLITNNIGNTFNDAVAYAKGTGGEYSILDRYSRD